MAQTAPNGLPLTDDATCTKVADFAVHPGEDSTLDRNWGGGKYTHSAVCTANTQIKSSAGVYGGFIVTVATAAGTIDVRDATAAGGGQIIATIAAGTAVGAYILPAGITFTTGIYLEYNAGPATGSIVVAYL